MSKGFQERHRILADAMRKAATSSKGKWAINIGQNKTGKSAQTKPYDISRKRDVASFLLQARRVTRSDAPSALVNSF